MTDRAQMEISPGEEVTVNLSAKATELLSETDPTFTTRRRAVWTGDALDLLSSRSSPSRSADRPSDQVMDALRAAAEACR